MDAKCDDIKPRAARPSERLLKEWAPGRVRILHRGLWWCWDRCGYTSDMAMAGVYDADVKTWRGEDEVVLVDPERFAIDAIMQRVTALVAENATMHLRVGEWMDDDAERSVRLVKAEAELAEARATLERVRALPSMYRMDAKLDWLAKSDGADVLIDVAEHLREVFDPNSETSQTLAALALRLQTAEASEVARD